MVLRLPPPPRRISPSTHAPFLAILAALAFAVGCDPLTSDDLHEDPGGTDPGTDPDPDPVDEIELTFTLDGEIADGISTTATVSWSVELDETDATLESTYLEFGVDDAFDRTRLGLPTEDGSFEAQLYGLVPAEDHGIRAVAVVDGTAYASESITLTAGAPPVGLPSLTTGGNEDGGGEDDGGYLLTSIVSVPSTAVVMDTRGNYVWWYESPVEGQFITRAHLSRAGDSVILLAWDSAPDAPENSVPRILEVGFDGHPIREVPVPGAHHDFVELPDGTLAVLVEDVRTVGAHEVIGDSIIEIAPDGTETEAWSSWDQLDFALPPGYPEPTFDWTHANAIDHDGDRDVYHVSLYRMASIVEVDRASGELNWTLGGPQSDFLSPTQGSFLFDGNHQFQMLGDRILAFENGTELTEHSRAVELQLDADLGTAHEVWSYASNPPLLSFTLGDVSRMDGGHTLITWATCGRIDRVTPEGEVAWSVSGALGGGFGYTTWFADWPEGL